MDMRGFKWQLENSNNGIKKTMHLIFFKNKITGQNKIITILLLIIKLFSNFSQTHINQNNQHTTRNDMF